ncbi:MAG: hypothetical protein E2O29_01780 [Deltaproteobacteria bacterium]|nr:MAG: hypothetical protein E2O29_01780 [Deltaproteobacteria bacterium]
MQTYEFKRYWVQGEHSESRTTRACKVFLKTNDKQKAIAYILGSKREVFIWDCMHRKLVDANYNCKIL